MYRRAYALLVGIALLMGTAAVTTAIAVDKRLVDPEGFLGPSWLRLPLLVLGALLLDLLPRTLWLSRLRPALMPEIVRTRLKTHWTRERMTLVVMGLVCFYTIYVSYRNLKSFLPFTIMGDTKYDRTLHLVDRALMFGHEPGLVLHQLLGTGFMAYFLSYVYLWFLPLVPLALTALADLVEEHHLRLLVRHVAGDRLVARHAVLLRAPDARPWHRLSLHLHRSAEARRRPS